MIGAAPERLSMLRTLIRRGASALAAMVGASPTLAHVTSSDPVHAHWHSSDLLGLAVLVALGALAIWIDRRSR